MVFRKISAQTRGTPRDEIVTVIPKEKDISCNYVPPVFRLFFIIFPAVADIPINLVNVVINKTGDVSRNGRTVSLIEKNSDCQVLYC